MIELLSQQVAFKNRSKAKAIPIAWFKSIQGRHGYLRVERYLEVLNNGMIRVVDITRAKTSVCHTFGNGLDLFASSQEIFQYHWNSVVERKEAPFYKQYRP
jgi:hypothetical protein